MSVVWCLYPDELHNSDGKYIGYLSNTPANHSVFRSCDPELYRTLRQLIHANNRHVVGLRESGTLPDDTVFYERSLSYDRVEPRPSRQAIRASWLEGALQATAQSDVVFVDPDNGISETADPWGKNGPKFVFIEDLRQFVERGQSLIIYHHLGRRGTAIEQIRYFARCLQVNLNLLQLPWSLWYHRGTARAYFIIAQERHRYVLESRLTRFLKSPWCEHFELVE